MFDKNKKKIIAKVSAEMSAQEMGDIMVFGDFAKVLSLIIGIIESLEQNTSVSGKVIVEMIVRYFDKIEKGEI